MDTSHIPSVPVTAMSLKTAVYMTRMKLGAHPGSLPLLIPWRRSMQELLVRTSTDACIDGFPRSGQTYALTVFRRRNPGVSIAHHMHLAGQVLRAVKLGVACVVLVRQPMDSISSMLTIDPRLPVELAVWSYIDFYRRSWPVKDYVAVCAFDEIVADASVVSRRLNERVGTAFDTTPVDSPEREQIMAELDAFGRDHPNLSPWVAIPDENIDKTKRRAVIVDRLRKSRRLHEAQMWYDRWAGT